MKGYGLWFGLCALAVLCFAAGPFLVYWHASPDMQQGVVQKIFYYHVSAAWVTLVSAMWCGCASLCFLFTRHVKWDARGAAAGELALLFGTMVLASGPLWARKAWGVYWTWEPRLSSTLLLWLIFLAYAFLRRYGGVGSNVLAAGLAVLGALDVPVIWWAFKIGARSGAPTGSHPPGRDVVRQGLDAHQLQAFLFCLVAFTLLWFLFYSLRARQHRLTQELDELYIAATAEE